MSDLAKRLAERTSAGVRSNDWGRQWVLDVNDASEILTTHRETLPPHIVTPLSAVEDASRDPPTHILLKPTAFIELTNIIQKRDSEHAKQPDRTATVS